MHDRKRSTSMTRLINKIERRLGTEPLNLPDKLNKDAWGDIIAEDSLTTFSRYFPHIVPYKVDTANDKVDELTNAFYIDQDYLGEEIDVLGMRDLDMATLTKLNSRTQVGGYIGNRYSMHGTGFGTQDIANVQIAATMNSFYNSGVFVEFKHPNKIVIEGINGADRLRRMGEFVVELFVTHPANLGTMSPTVMEEFERLALVDIKIFLYNSLKHYNNIETVYANIDMLIDDWSGADREREEIINDYKEQYVSFANTNQPMIFTI